MRCSLLAVLVAVLALACSQVSAQTFCQNYSTALGVDQTTLFSALITRVVFGTRNISSTLNGAQGTFVGLRKIDDDNTPRDVLDVVSSANFAETIVQTITLVGSTGSQVVGVARRPANGLFYFMDQEGQLYSGDVDAAIRTFNTTVTITPIGTAVGARAAAVVESGTGFAFNPVADRIRIVNGARNFRVNPDTGAANNASASGDQTDGGGTIQYDIATAPANAATPNMVATAYSNQVNPAPSTTTQYGIDAANNRLVTFSSPNAGNIGASVPLSGLPADANAFSGLTVVNGVIVLTVAQNNGAQAAYTIDLTTGAATAVNGSLGATPYRAIAFTPVASGNGIITPKNTLPGIAGSSNIVGFFNRGIIFEQGQPDYTQGQALASLSRSLVAFFGRALGCSETGFPTYTGQESQYIVHRNMNITQAQFETFNGQVAAAASSYGVTAGDVAVVGGFLGTFAKSTFGPQSQAICTAADCACAPGFGGDNCQGAATSSSSSGGGNGGDSSSSSSGGNGGGGDGGNAAAGLSAPFALVAALALAVAALRA